MGKEPVACQARHFLQGSRLLEEMGGTSHHLQLALAAQLHLCLTVELEHDLVTATHDEQRRLLAPGRASDRQDQDVLPARRLRRSMSRARRPPTELRPPRCWRRSSRYAVPLLRVVLRATESHPQSLRQEPYVEYRCTVELLVGGEQIEQEGAEPGRVQDGRHKAIARTVTTASAAVGEDDQSGTLLRNREVPDKPDSA